MAIAQVDLLDELANEKEALVGRLGLVIAKNGLAEAKEILPELEDEFRQSIEAVILKAVKQITDSNWLRSRKRKFFKWFRKKILGR